MPIIWGMRWLWHLQCGRLSVLEIFSREAHYLFFSCGKLFLYAKIRYYSSCYVGNCSVLLKPDVTVVCMYQFSVNIFNHYSGLLPFQHMEKRKISCPHLSRTTIPSQPAYHTNYAALDLLMSCLTNTLLILLQL